MKLSLLPRMNEARPYSAALGTLGIAAFLESSFLPVPIDLFFLPVAVYNRRGLLFPVLVGTAGSFFGALTGYLIGATLMGTLGAWLIHFYHAEAIFSELHSLYARFGWKIIVVAGITPLPFKFAAILAGAGRMNLGAFVLSVIGIRLVRFSMMGIFYGLFGQAVRGMMDRFGGWIALVLTGLAILAMFGAGLITLG